ncbi:hypothetical protein MJD09_25700, partial [bacterium]|nr:hypothetical protein [bacterium]
FASWAISGLIFDTLLDNRTIHKNEAIQIWSRWIDCIADVCLRNGHVGTTFRISQHEDFNYFTCRFLINAEKLIRSSASQDEITTRARVEFVQRANSLMEGEVSSIDQIRGFKEFSWSDYCASALNGKNIDYLLAPAVLLVSNSCELARYESLRKLFDSLNRVYVHYQILDDIADLEQDLESGICGAPTAIFLTQCELAVKYIEFVGRQHDEAKQKSAHTDELTAFFEGSRISVFLDLIHQNRFEIDTADEMYRNAFVDIYTSDSSMIKIAKQTLEARRAFDRHVAAKNISGASEIIWQSGVPERVLMAVRCESAMESFTKTLDSLEDRRRFEYFLFILESMMRHTYFACRRCYIAA